MGVPALRGLLQVNAGDPPFKEPMDTLLKTSAAQGRSLVHHDTEPWAELLQ